MKKLFLLVLMTLATACAHPIDGVILGLNESQRVLTTSHQILAEQHRQQRDDAVTYSLTEADARKAVAAVHAEYRDRWGWYERVRRGWITAASITAAAKLIESTGGKPDLPRALKAAQDVAIALDGFADEIRKDVKAKP